MRKAQSKTLFINIFLFIFIAVSPSSSSPIAEPEDNTTPFNYKMGAGNPNERNPNGTTASVFKKHIPKVTSLNPDEWLKVYHDREMRFTQYLGAHPSLNLNPTTNIFLEYFQFALLPEIKRGGKLSEEETIFTKAFNINGIKPKNLKGHVGCHLFLPDEIAEGSGAVLVLPGSKGGRESELMFCMRLANRGIPSLMPDFVSTAKTNETLFGNSTISDQLTVSFFGNALSIMLMHHTLQSWDKINNKRIVWVCESIGSTQALLALSQEIIDKFEAPFIPPAHLTMNDLAPVLTTSSIKTSPFWTISKTIFGGKADEFTPLSQVEDFLSSGPPDQPTTLKKHDGYHDARSLNEDTPGQEGGTYHLGDAKNYTGLCALMKPSIEALRDPLKHLDTSADADTIMAAIEAPFSSQRLYLRLENVDLESSQVMDRIRQLPKGATFGPGSQTEARKLRNERIEITLKYVLASRE